MLASKAFYELMYWRSRRLEEGTLENEWYVNIFTVRTGIDRTFYTGKKLLDVGCGPRGSLEWAEDAPERVCLDPLVDRYRALGIDRHQALYCHAPAESIPYPDGHFDFVSSINSLDHVDDSAAALREMSRVLAPGGLMLLVVEIHPRPTIAEPHVLPWDIAHRLRGDGMRIAEEHHLERPREADYLARPVPFDHDDPTERNGILLAKLTKESTAPLDEGADRGAGVRLPDRVAGTRPLR